MQSFFLKIKKQQILLLLLTMTVLISLLPVRLFFYPHIAVLKTQNPEITSFMKYRELQWKKKKRHLKAHISWTPLGQISPALISAVITSEDASFWKHHGFDVAAMRYAMEENLEAKKIKFGASTISQQLVKNLYLSPSKNIFRKFEEAILTWRIERTLSKKRILEIYLNVIEWGDGIFGISQAAHFYYHKNASDLTAIEAARLAVVLPSPLRLNPLSGSPYIKKRSEVILKRMHIRSPDITGLPQQMPVAASTAAFTPDTETLPFSDTNTSVNMLPENFLIPADTITATAAEAP